MSKIVECVPNFSEGRNQRIIDAISDAIRTVENVSLLDVDPGPSTNRTVYTFVGAPADVVTAALAAARVAFRLIDMANHKGEHPRMGALDVCPFIPVQGVDVDECIQCARDFGRKLSTELNVPVFLYGMAAEKGDYRKTLPQIRAGEYEGLSDKLKDPLWQPDFGPREFQSSWGATATGVRKFLIAYNINVLGTKEQAHRIALNLREQGRSKTEPGRLRCVQGIGWWLNEANLAQISLNLTDFDVTPLHVAYEEACKDATELNVAITGSEIVGLVPLNALLQAADYYMKKENLMILEQDQKVHLVINRLGLSSLHPFDPKERIIEYRLPAKKDKKLTSYSVENFILNVGARSPAPGGGSVAALVGALGCGLATMVGQMTYGKRQFEALDAAIRQILPRLHDSMMDSIPMIDADTDAFNDYMAAMKLPQSSEMEKLAREKAIDQGLKKAIYVPLNLAKHINSVWEAVLQMATVGNINCKSDLQVGAHCLETSVMGAYYNVMINMTSIRDEDWKAKIQKEIDEQIDLAKDKCQQVLTILNERKN